MCSSNSQPSVFRQAKVQGVRQTAGQATQPGPLLSSFWRYLTVLLHHVVAGKGVDQPVHFVPGCRYITCVQTLRLQWPAEWGGNTICGIWMGGCSCQLAPAATELVECATIDFLSQQRPSAGAWHPVPYMRHQQSNQRDKGRSSLVEGQHTQQGLSTKIHRTKRRGLEHCTPNTTPSFKRVCAVRPLTAQP